MTSTIFAIFAKTIKENKMEKLYIPHKQREHFKKSFLHTVSFMLYLDTDLGIKDSMVEYMEGQGWIFTPIEDQNMNMFYKENNSIMCMGTFIFMVISIPTYKSFDDIHNIITDITAILKSDNIKSIRDMHLMKENRYKLKHELNKGKEWLIETLFSDAFSKAFPVEKDNFNFETGEYVNEISLKQTHGNETDSLTFRILTSTNKMIETEHWDEEIMKMNESLYDIWRWAVSDNVIKMMS